MATRSLTENEKQIWRAIDAIQNKTERAIIGNYKTALDSIRLELTRVYEKYAKAGVLTHAEMTKFNRLSNLHNQIGEVMGPVFSKNNRAVINLSKVQYEEAFYRYSWAIDQHAGVSLRWGLLNEDLVAATVGRGEQYTLISDPRTRELAVYNNELRYRAFKGIRADGLAKLNRVIDQGLIKGQSYPQMAKAVKKVIDGKAYESIRIARTEGQRAAVLGQLEQAERTEALDIEMKRIWDATLDGATRPEHGELDGQAADEDGMFHTPVGLIAGPLQSGDPAWDINCRCRIREEIEEYPPQIRRQREEGLQPYQTYNEWAEKKGIKVKK